MLTPIKTSLFQCVFEVSVVVTQVCATVLRTLHGPRERAFLLILFAIELHANPSNVGVE